MRRPLAWYLKRLVVFLVLFVLTYGLGRLVVVWSDSQYDGVREPYLQSMSSQGVTLRWHTVEAARGVVRYGTAPDRLDAQVAEIGAVSDHHVRLTGLAPGTRYFYSVGTADTVFRGGNDFWFITAPAWPSTAAPGTPGDAVLPRRLWVTGDMGQPGEGQQAVARAARDWARAHLRASPALYDAWLTTGDNAYRSGSMAQFQAALFDPFADLLRNIPFWPAYGNHDARRWAFFELFDLPRRGEAGGVPSGSEHYFAFDNGPVHVVFVDTQEGDLSSDSAMLDWLVRDLAANQRPWVIAVMHHPPYSRGSHDSDSPQDSGGRMWRVREQVVPLLERGGVDLVLSGHSHMYERSHLMACHYGDSQSWRPTLALQGAVEGRHYRYLKRRTGAMPAGGGLDGTIYAVVGSSSRLDDGPLDHPAMAVSRHAMGSLLIDVDGQTLTAQFIEHDGSIGDRFTIQKGRPEGPAPLVQCPPVP